MRTSDVDPRDYKYIVASPDASFSPQRNQAVINETIKDTEKFFHELMHGKDAEMEDRIDILSSYGAYRFNKGTKEFKDYAGKALMSRLIGEKILSKVKVLQAADKFSKRQRILL